MEHNEDGSEIQREPSAEDLAVAEEVLEAASNSTPADGDEYRRQRSALAIFRASVGPDRFDLLYGRREPRNGSERLTLRANREAWSEDRQRAEYCAYANRPVDGEMLRDFFAMVEGRVQAYSEVLSMIIAAATDQRDRERGWREEESIESAFSDLSERFSLFKEELLTIDKFLTQIRALHGTPVTCGDRKGSNAHGLVLREIADARAQWASVVGTSHKSRTDPACSYRISAAELFYNSRINCDDRIGPQDLLVVMEVERADAEMHLARGLEHGGPVPLMGASAARPTAPEIEPRVDPKLVQSNWLPAAELGPALKDKVRKAAQSSRKTKRVDSNETNGVTFYYLPDILRYWPGDVPEHLRPGRRT